MAIDSFHDILSISGEISKLEKTSADWQSLLNHISKSVAADFAVAVERFPSASDRGLIHYSSASRRQVQDYQCSLFKLDKNAEAAKRVTFAVATRVSQDQANFRPLLAHFNVGCGLIFDCVLNDNIELRLFLGRFSHQNPFSPQDAYLIDSLGQQLGQSVKYAKQLQALKQGETLFSSAIEALPLATIIIDAPCNIAFQNSKASKILAKESAFLSENGILKAADTDVAFEFHRALRTLIQAPTKGLCDLTEILRIGRYQALLRRLKLGHIVLYVFDTETHPVPDQELLKKLFQFTNSESQLAMLLAKGLTIDEAKEVLGITKNTARTHLRSIFVKCGVTRQASLVQKIVTSAAMIH